MSTASQRKDMLDTARYLFNTRGYDRVSMRQLAEELHMAVGNLTYYFPRKQQIVEELMDESFARTRVDTPVDTLAQLNEMLSRMLDTLLCNSFFFLDDAFASDRRNQEHHGYLRARLQEGLRRLTAQGLFQPAFTPEIQDTVLSMLLMTHVTWLRAQVRAHALDQQALQAAKAAFLQAHWVILSPYLTSRGMDELAQMSANAASAMPAP